MGLMLFDIQQAKGSTDKIERFRKWIPSYEEATGIAVLWHWMMNPYITFGLSKVPTIVKRVETNDNSNVIGLLGMLSSRTLSGDVAKTTVYRFWEQLDPTERRAFMSIIEKNPKCGVGAKTVNKACPGLVPEFNISKPQYWKDRERHARALCNKGAIVDTKENGLRRIYVRDTHQFLTSRGHECHVFPIITDYLRLVVPKGCVIDGELVHNTGTLQDMAGMAQRGTVDETGICTFHAFDVLTTEDWVIQESIVPQHERTQWLQGADWGPGPVESTEVQWVTTVDEMDAIFFRIIGRGGEGIIVKDPNAPYQFSRNQCWVKRKLQETVDVPVIGILPGKPGTKLEATMGSFRCTLPTGIEFNCSGKITDEQRDEIWRNQERYIGRIIEVAYQQETPAGSLEHPRFIRFRGDKVS